MSRPTREALLGYEPIDCWDALDRECTDAIRRHREAGRSAAWCYAWLVNVVARASLLDDGGVWRLAAEIGGWERCASCGEYEWDCTCGDVEVLDVSEREAAYRAWHRAIYHCEPSCEDGRDRYEVSAWVADSMSEGGAP
jgi:hypothetical protein